MDADLYEYQWGSRDLNPGPTDYVVIVWVVGAR
jgi:hypothetical protein